jgi:hypothetical protein
MNKDAKANILVERARDLTSAAVNTMKPVTISTKPTTRRPTMMYVPIGS